MTTIYLVRTSDYDDGDVYAAYDDKELAEKAAALIDDGIIEAHELNLHAVEIQAGLIPWWLHMDADGNVSNSEKETGYGGVLDGRGFQVIQSSIKREEGKLFLRCNMFARDEVHAIEIANAIRLRLLADGQFVAGVRSD